MVDLIDAPLAELVARWACKYDRREIERMKMRRADRWREYRRGHEVAGSRWFVYHMPISQSGQSPIELKANES